MSRRHLLAALAGAGLLAAVALAVVLSSSGGASSHLRFVPNRAKALATGEREGSRGEGDKDGGELVGGPAAQQVGDRAYPRTYVETKRALAARRAFRSHPSRLAAGDFRASASNAQVSRGRDAAGTWTELGPVTPNTPGIVTYTGRDTTVSGRVTAMAIDPTCDDGNAATPHPCRMWVGAAGGGVWRTDDALAATPAWAPVSSGLTSNAIGALVVDPNDPTGDTLYAGTGEQNGSGDSEAGTGLFKSTDGGDTWTLVGGSYAVAHDRAIGAIVVDPSDAQHILIGTSVARHGSSSVNGGRFTPPNAPALGVYESTDGGATFSSSPIFSKPDSTSPPESGVDWFQGGINHLELDPNNAHALYVAAVGYGIYRVNLTTDTAQHVFLTRNPGDEYGDRTEFALADLTPLGGANAGKTRIYAGDSSDDQEVAEFWSDDDAAAIPALAAGDDNATDGGWTRRSSSATSNPAGYSSYDYCQNGQCGYDNFVASPTGHPDQVWLGGSMAYDDLVYDNAGDLAGPSNGRAVVRSTNAGVSFSDMTNDNQSPPLGMHPDQHAIVFDPANPAIAFMGSDGGVVRTDGSYVSPTNSCASRGLSGDQLADCNQLLSAIPNQLLSLNDGLRTLQFQSLTASPVDPTSDIIGGTQDNGTWAFTDDPDPTKTWFESVGGDGGQSAIDAGNPAVRMHTYYAGSGDVNFAGNNPDTWDYNTGPLDNSGEDVSFYNPVIGDPVKAGTFFSGLQHVWRTTDSSGPQGILDANCREPASSPSCGDWVPVGQDLTGAAFGDRAGQYVVALARGADDKSTLWAATRTGRLFVSTNADAGAGSVAFHRVDLGDVDPATANFTPGRFVSSIVVDPNDSDHAWISYSGYEAYAPGGHVYEVRYDPATHALSSVADLDYDLADEPINGLARDAATGDLYAATDFGVLRLAKGANTWQNVSGGLAYVSVFGLTLPDGSRSLLAASHGRGAWSYQLPAAPTAAISGPATGHVGDALTYDGSGSTASPGQTVSSYAWTFPDGSTQSGPSVTWTPSTPVTGRVKLVVTDSAGLQSIARQSVSVTAAVTPPPTTTPTTTGTTTTPVTTTTTPATTTTTTTPATTPTVPVTPPPATSRAKVRLRVRSVSIDKRRFAHVKLTCTKAAACRGTLTLRSPARRGHRQVVFGVAKYSIKAGHSATIRVRLARTRLALVSHARKFRGSVLAQPRGRKRGSLGSVTFVRPRR